MPAEVLHYMAMHSCFQGLDEHTLADIARHVVLAKYETNECVHGSETPLTDIFLIVQGSLKASYLDFHGHEQTFRVMCRDDQLGILSAALNEPLPATVVAQQPTTVLKLDYRIARELTAKHDAFRINLLRSVGNSLRQTFFEHKVRRQPRILAVFHSSPATRAVSHHLLHRLVDLGERPCVVSDREIEQTVTGADYCTFGGDRGFSESEVREQVGRHADSGRFFIETDATLDPPRTAQLIDLSDAVIWCLQPGDEEPTLNRLMSAGVAESGSYKKISLVWSLADHAQTRPVMTGSRELAAREFKLSLSRRSTPLGGTLTNGLERIVHFLRGVQIGVALGGGAARGMAHLGVLQALEENGIVVDMIAGTSAGAMTGIVYASGLEADYCARQFAADLTPSWPFRWMPRGNQWYLLSKYRRGHFDGMLRKYLSNWQLEELAIPSSAVTVDLISGEALVRDRGDAVHAILESINLPVLSLPICRNGRALIDGGLVNNIPADVLVQRGCNFVIAVSVTAKIEKEFAHNRPDTPTSRMRRASTVQTVLRSFLVQSMNMNSVGVRPADVIIEPDVTEFDLTEFTRAVEMASVGEQTALGSVTKIKRLLSQLDDRLFGDR